MKNSLVTGAAGFIGSHVVRLFVTKYPDYRIVDLDLLTYAGNLASLRAIEAMDSPFLRRERIDCIWGMLIIAFPDLSRMELEAPSG